MRLFKKSQVEKERDDYKKRANNDVNELFDSYTKYSEEDRNATRELIEKLEKLANEFEHYDKQKVGGLAAIIKRIFP